MRVLIADAMSDLAAQVLREGGIEVDVRTDLAPEGLVACIGAYDGSRSR